MAYYQWKTGGKLLLYCQLQTNTQSNAFAGIFDDRIKIRIKSPPIEGKANKELVTFLAKSFKTRKSAVKITRGETSREKTVIIDQPENIPEQLDILIPYA